MISRNATNAKPSYAAFMADYGTAVRTFNHGELDGLLSGFLLALSNIDTNALLIKKVGGIICT